MRDPAEHDISAGLSRATLAHAVTRPPLPRWTVLLVVTLVLAATAVVLSVLWQWIDNLALADAEKKAAAHLDAIKVAASIAVGGGGLFALYLAARRQRTQELELDARHAELLQRDRVQAHAEQVAETNRVHAERVAAASERDAVDRRITELYAKSVEQLGSDKAPVRLGGLYALERLAQDNLDQRPTVVNVLCAYLRMPYPSPTDSKIDDLSTEHVQERQVRLTAQRILATHLDSGYNVDHPAETFWPRMDLDLTGAMLIDLDLSGCQVRAANFTGATFTGNASFSGATFAGSARFGDATFLGHSWFRYADFENDAWFHGARFVLGAEFDRATFDDIARFDGARFGRAQFHEVTFNGVARFVAATFDGDAQFYETTFTGDAQFENAKFFGEAQFVEATFSKEAQFEEASFDRKAEFVAAAFMGYAQFDGTTFSEDARFDDATFNEDPELDNALIAHRPDDFSVLPAGWHLAGQHHSVSNRDGTWHRLIRTPTSLADSDENLSE